MIDKGEYRCIIKKAQHVIQDVEITPSFQQGSMIHKALVIFSILPLLYELSIAVTI